jgi:hypothetical protein
MKPVTLGSTKPHGNGGNSAAVACPGLLVRRTSARLETTTVAIVQSSSTPSATDALLKS